MKKHLPLVDYENVHKIDLSLLDDSYQAIIFVGANQEPPKAARNKATSHRFTRVHDLEPARPTDRRPHVGGRAGGRGRRLGVPSASARRPPRRGRRTARHPAFPPRPGPSGDPRTPAHRGPPARQARQPWRFVVVSEMAGTRERAARMADEQRLRQAHQLEPESARRLLDLQLEGAARRRWEWWWACDRRTPAAGVLGRATFPDADLWSCACAIENLWLAARGRGARRGLGDALCDPGRPRGTARAARRRRHPRLALPRLARRAPAGPRPGACRLVASSAAR